MSHLTKVLHLILSFLVHVIDTCFLKKGKHENSSFMKDANVQNSTIEENINKEVISNEFKNKESI